MTADRRFDPEETDSAADDALIAALALYDETRDTGAASDLGDTGPPDPELQGRFELLRGVLDDLARLREADPPRTAGIAEPAGSDSTATGAAPSPGIADDAPRIIGRFVIEEELGRGGHGIVFRAHDPALGRDVALKVPRPELLLSEAARKRFLREGRSTASLAHPNLVTVFEAGEAGPVCYLAQEYCAGPNLETWLGAQRRAVPSRQAAELVAQLAEGVEHAHRRGVVHRDLKPGNVLMQPVSGNVKGSRIESADLAVADARESWVPRIVDFGLARLEEGAGTLTATGALVGTPAYMAPEQLEASRGAVGPASDIYALGGILFQVLTGQTPFNGASQTELIKQILLDEPRRPRQVRRDLPADLEAICLRALEKRPADRYVSAGEMAADLRRFLRGEPTRARPLRANEKLVRWARHKPWAAALVVVVALSLFTMVAMAGAYTVQLRAALAETKQRRDEAENSRQIVRRQLYASDIRLAQEALDAYRLGECVSILDRQRPAPGDLDLREFAWGYLWHRTHSAQRELLGNEGEQYAVEYSPDGSLLVAAGADGVVRLWEADTGRLRQELRDSHSEVNALAFSADGSQLAAVNDAGELLIWSLAGSSSLKCRAAVSATELYAVRFSPDGQQTAVAGDDGYVRVVATLDGAIQRELPGHTQPVYALAYWQGGHHLISGGRQGQLLDWDLTNDADAQSRTWPIVGNGPIRSLEFTPDETHLAFCQDDVYIVRVGDDDAMNRISCDTAPFSSVRFSADGKWIVIGSMDSTWRMGPWNRKRDDLAVVAAHQGRVHAIAVSPLRDEVASVGADGFVRQWSNPWPSNQFTLTASGALRYTAEFSAHGERLILKYGEKDDSSNLVSSDWDGNAWQAVHYWKSSERNAAIRCAISSDGKWIVRTDGGANLLAWQRELSTEWRKIGSLEPLIGELALAPAAPLVIGSNMGTLAAWDLEPARLRWKVEIPRSDVRQLTSSERLVACSVGSEVRVYDLLTGKLLLSRQTPGSEIHALAIAVDSRQLLAAGTDRSIYRWTLPGGDKLPSWIAHGAIVEGLAIDASGRTVASFDSDSILKIWHPPTGQAILSLYAETPNRMVFSPDGRYLHLGGSASRDWGVWSLHSVLPTSVSGIAKQAASSRFPEVESVPPASVPDDAVASAEAAEESHPASIGDGLILDARTQAVALQSNGKIVAVGYSNNGRDDDFVIARFNANGSLDTLFSGDGKQSVSFGSFDHATSVAVQADGKIVVAGYTGTGANLDFAVTRLNADGSLDSSFDGDGKWTGAFGSAQDIAYSVVVQPDGKILVAGLTSNGSNYDFALVRLNANGSLDTSFDGDGKATQALGSGDDIAYAVGLQADGKIVLAGSSYHGNDDFAAVRYNTNGSLDTSFDGDGRVWVGIGSAADEARALAIQSDGKLVLAGKSNIGGSNQFSLVRLDANGSLDSSFDGDGKLTTAVSGSTDVANGLVIQPDNKLVAAGYSRLSGHSRVALARYNTDGSLDDGSATDSTPSDKFANDGAFTTSLHSNSDEEAFDAVLQPDGKLVVVGTTLSAASDINALNDFLIIRFEVDGSLDRSFGEAAERTDAKQLEGVPFP